MDNSFNKFMQCEISLIKLEQSKTNDSSDKFILDWIQNNSAGFRQKWDNSICKNCKNSNSCGWLVKTSCDKFSEDQK